jgi:hypothetical protein
MRILLTIAVLLCSTPLLAKPKQGEPCDEQGECAKGLTCVRYRGVAGAAGPEMTSCEIRCSSKIRCPKSQRCTIIADGPGQMCRPAPARHESKSGS